jgi:periplasmic copper chaperone A
MKRRTFLALALLPAMAQAHSSRLGSIAIGHAWAMPSVSTEAEVMIPLFNSGAVPDALVSATSPMARSVELQTENNLALEFVLEPMKPFPMRSVANHLQLLGLTKPLIKGDRFPLTLKFKNAGEIEIQIHVSDKSGD